MFVSQEIEISPYRAMNAGFNLPKNIGGPALRTLAHSPKPLPGKPKSSNPQQVTKSAAKFVAQSQQSALLPTLSIDHIHISEHVLLKSLHRYQSPLTSKNECKLRCFFLGCSFVAGTIFLSTDVAEVGKQGKPHESQ